MVINRTELAPLRERINCGQTRTESEEEVEKKGQKNKKQRMGKGKSLSQRDQGIICRETRSKLNIQKPSDRSDVRMCGIYNPR